jgi:low affinity Fe/Cu permease
MEAFLAADSSMVLLVLAALAVVLLVGRFLLNLAWRLVAVTTVGIVTFYAVAVVLPSVFALV